MAQLPLADELMPRSREMDFSVFGQNKPKFGRRTTGMGIQLPVEMLRPETVRAPAHARYAFGPRCDQLTTDVALCGPAVRRFRTAMPSQETARLTQGARRQRGVAEAGCDRTIDTMTMKITRSTPLKGLS